MFLSRFTYSLDEYLLSAHHVEDIVLGFLQNVKVDLVFAIIKPQGRTC